MKNLRITLITCICIFATYSFTFSQNKVVHEKKTFIADNGRIYWNKNLPVFINLSTSENGDGITMKEESKEKMEPFYFDTEGINWIRTRWAVSLETGETILPKREIMWPILADGKAPVTKIRYHYTGKHVINGKTYYSGDLKISFNSQDAVSGIDAIYYSLGNGFKKYDDEFTIENEDDWNLQFYAVDKVGNVESPEKTGQTNLQFTVDKTTPVTKFTFTDPKLDNIISPDTKFSFEGSDNGSGVKNIYYKINENGNIVYSTAFDLSHLEDGEHNITYYATDNVKNQESSKTFNFYLDKIAPALNYAVSGSQYRNDAGRLYISNRSKLTLTGTDKKAGLDKIFYNIDDNKYDEYLTPINADQVSGLHTLAYYGTDKVENTSKKHHIQYTIDAKPPVISYKAIGPQLLRNDTLFARTLTAFIIFPYEAGVNQSGLKSVKYKIDNGSLSDYTEKFTIPGDGLKELQFEVSDNVNNQSSKKQIVFLDNVPPEINPIFSVDKIGTKKVRDKSYVIYPKETKVYLTATDLHVGTDKIYYSINGNDEIQSGKPVQYFKQGANITIDIRAVDLLGNESKKSITFSVE